MSDGELVIFLRDLAREAESSQNLRKAQMLQEAADKLADMEGK